MPPRRRRAAQETGGHGRRAVHAIGVRAPALGQRAGCVLEAAVAHEPIEELARRLVGVELLELLIDVLLEQQA